LTSAAGLPRRSLHAVITAIPDNAAAAETEATNGRRTISFCVERKKQRDGGEEEEGMTERPDGSVRDNSG
jgi:hypothetical protein